MTEKYDKYSFKVSKSKPFDFKRFLNDWKTDGGWWRICINGKSCDLYLLASAVNQLPFYRFFWELSVRLERFAGGLRLFLKHEECYFVGGISLSDAMVIINNIKKDLEKMKEKQTTINVYGDFDKPEPIKPKFKVGDNILRNVKGIVIAYIITSIVVDSSVNIGAYGLAYFEYNHGVSTVYKDISEVDSSSALIVDYNKSTIEKPTEVENTDQLINRVENESEPTE